jgi:type IV secretion system protein VirB3
MDRGLTHMQPGYEVTIHQSAIKPQLVLGIPRQLAIVLYTVVAALTLPLATWYAVPAGLALHTLFAAAAKKDPLFWDVSRRGFHYRTFYRG